VRATVLLLKEMDDDAFRAFLDRAVPRRAERWVRRGIWLPERALETSREEYGKLFSQGRQTPTHHFFDVLEEGTGTPVGEAWITAEPSGGKLHYWIQWISIWPEHRRKGYGAELLELLREDARRRGAEKTILTVWLDNPGALALYTKMGYRTENQTMARPV
jgi:ribosomal protein S18 acetylase RimI-like enzyme